MFAIGEFPIGIFAIGGFLVGGFPIGEFAIIVGFPIGGSYKGGFLTGIPPIGKISTGGIPEGEFPRGTQRGKRPRREFSESESFPSGKNKGTTTEG